MGDNPATTGGATVKTDLELVRLQDEANGIEDTAGDLELTGPEAWDMANLTRASSEAYSVYLEAAKAIERRLKSVLDRAGVTGSTKDWALDVQPDRVVLKRVPRGD